MSASPDDLTRLLARLERRVQRETTARLEAERLLESKSLELYQANRLLLALNSDLEQRVHLRTLDVERERRIAVELAERDLLTRLANRARFQSHLALTVARCAETGSQAALLIIDLDRFKQVNDRLGHAAGDALLIQVAGRLQTVLRNDDLVARLGGDEFAIVLSDPSDATAAGIATAKRIRDALSAPCKVEGLPLLASCSIGIAVVPTHATIETNLMRYADLALYAAKARGRGRFATFKPAMLAEFEDRHQLELDLLEAVSANEISVHLQPIVDTRSQGIVAAEVLARWRHPTRGMISPARFIQIAEQRGLIETLGHQVLRLGCQQALPFLRDGSIKRISINMSPLQLQNGDIVEQVCAILTEFELRPDQLLLEVTESVMLTDHPTVQAALDGFWARGIHLALDDFGAGYSNLSYLTRLKVNVLKIDRGFINDLKDGSATVAVIRSISDLAHELGLDVVVEGVETEEQLRLVTSFGCSFVQGYLFSKPVLPSDFALLLQRDQARAIAEHHEPDIGIAAAPRSVRSKPSARTVTHSTIAVPP